MDISQIYWIILCGIAGGGGYLYGKYTESLKHNHKKYDKLDTEELENKKDLSLYKEEPKDTIQLKKELFRERETNRKVVEQYETEIGFLKNLLTKNQANFNEKLERQEKTQKLFEEMSNELGPIVQIIEGSQEVHDGEIEKAIDDEFKNKLI